MDRVRGLFTRKKRSKSTPSSASHATLASMATIPESTELRVDEQASSSTTTTTTTTTTTVTTSSGVSISASVVRLQQSEESDLACIARLDSKYFALPGTEFDSQSSTLDQLPDLFSSDDTDADADTDTGGGTMSLDYLERETTQLKEWHAAIERTFKKKLLDNSHKFLDGIKKIREVQLDLRLTESNCLSSRSTLASVKKALVHDCFVVISQQQRRRRCLLLATMLAEMHALLDAEKQLRRALDHSRFLQAIDLHQRITQSLQGRMLGVSALDRMRTRFRVCLFVCLFVFLSQKNMNMLRIIGW